MNNSTKIGVLGFEAKLNFPRRTEIPMNKAVSAKAGID
jgi:hypothetical protein